MEKFAAVTVLYNPPVDELLSNAATYISGVDRLYLIDNSDTDHEKEISGRLSTSTPVSYIPNRQNRGIAAALNQAASMAINAGYEWLLTMDQDSAFRSDDLNRYMEAVNSLQDIQDVAAIGVPHSADDEEQRRPGGFEEVTGIITSGSFINLQWWKTIGGFEEKLFIDEVDYEYGYRSLLHGKKLLLFTGIILSHNLGSIREAGYLGIARRRRMVHSPRRIYFMIRNYLYVRKKYRHFIPGEFKKRDKLMLTAIKNNLFFSGRFLSTLFSIYKGYRDYRNNRFDATI